jgi:hypothetical protein
MKSSFLAALVALAAVAPLHAQGAAEFQRPTPNIHRDTNLQPLALPSNASPVAVVAQFLRAKVATKAPHRRSLPSRKARAATACRR